MPKINEELEQVKYELHHMRRLFKASLNQFGENLIYEYLLTNAKADVEKLEWFVESHHDKDLLKLDKTYLKEAQEILKLLTRIVELKNLYIEAEDE